METKNIVIAGIVGAVVAALLAAALGSEKGKKFLTEATGALKNEFLDKASNTVKELTGSAADIAKNSLKSAAQSPQPA